MSELFDDVCGRIFIGSLVIVDFGVIGTAMQWAITYLICRCQCLVSVKQNGPSDGCRSAGISVGCTMFLGLQFSDSRKKLLENRFEWMRHPDKSLDTVSQIHYKLACIAICVTGCITLHSIVINKLT